MSRSRSRLLLTHLPLLIFIHDSPVTFCIYYDVLGYSLLNYNRISLSIDKRLHYTHSHYSLSHHLLLHTLIMATERVKASVLHGEKDLRLVSTNTLKFPFCKQVLIKDTGRA